MKVPIFASLELCGSINWVWWGGTISKEVEEVTRKSYVILIFKIEKYNIQIIFYSYLYMISPF